MLLQANLQAPAYLKISWVIFGTKRICDFSHITCPKKVVTNPVVNDTNVTNDGFQKVVNRKRNNKRSSASNKLPKGVLVSKGFQAGKEFSYQPKASNVGSNGNTGTRSETSSKAGPSKNMNDDASLITKGANTRHQYTGKKKISNIASPNPFAALGVDGDEEEEVNTQADHRTLFCSFVYADNYYIDHRVLWSNLVGHAGLMRNRPWVLGDFNAALNPEDHSAGSYEPNAAMCEFKEIMINLQFNDDFPRSFAIFQPYRISHHSPCVLCIPTGCAMFRVVKRLKGLKSPFCKLLHNHGNLHERVNNIRIELDEAQKVIDRDPSSSILHEEHAHYLLAFKEAQLDEERFLKQKAKIEWLKAGNSNTAYLHKIVKSKCVRNRIEMVSNASNNLYDGNQVPGAFVNHYNQFLGAEGVTIPLDDHDLFTRVLDDAKADFMVLDVSNNEVKSVIFSIGDDRAPGPDNFTAVFFKKAWDVVGGDITYAVRDFFFNGKLLKELNHTIISLIPKVTSPARINDSRPISYCNVLYKCISKIIANRVKEGLGDIVSINQSTFVHGHRISNNILLTQELMRNYHRRCGPSRCAFKVDIQKAYDTMDWSFLETILVGFGFHPKMGDPLSPYLFTLVMEILTLILQQKVRDSDDFQYHLLCLVPSIPMSTAFFCNVSNAIKASILNSMPFAEGVLPVRYLGVPLISFRLLYCDCKILVEKLESGVNDRRNKFLSLVGRLQLIWMVLSSMHIYWASVFILLIRIVHDLEQLMRGFLWCQGKMKKGKAKVAWDSVCMPKYKGGLVF
ncbi:sodium/hydrogen exchanger 6 [Tanacetum coccineum]